MAASNVSRGARAKGRTKKWLEDRGYTVADLEVVHWVWTPKGRLPIKRDQFASDLLAVNVEKILFVQVKSGKSASGGTFPEAKRAFQQFETPPGALQVVIAWPLRARVPRVFGWSLGEWKEIPCNGRWP